MGASLFLPLAIFTLVCNKTSFDVFRANKNFCEDLMPVKAAGFFHKNYVSLNYKYTVLFCDHLKKQIIGINRQKFKVNRELPPFHNPCMHSFPSFNLEAMFDTASLSLFLDMVLRYTCSIYPNI